MLPRLKKRIARSCDRRAWLLDEVQFATLFQSGVMDGGFAPAGVLADFLEVEARYEGVVEDFLRDG